MSVVKHFIEDSVKKAKINEFLRNEFERAGYGGVDITKTPLGTHIVVYTMRPGMVIGRGGETIRQLAEDLGEKFQLPNPQISVAEIEIPELNAHVIAARVASALKRGVHYRRAGFWALNRVMEAGALGAEIIISGKLRTDRARYEKFRAGYLPKSGDPVRKYSKRSELHVQMKPGVLGVKVRIMPPNATFPDQVKIIEKVVKEEAEPVETSEPAETAETTEVTETIETTETVETSKTTEPTEASETSEAAETTEVTETTETTETKTEETEETKETKK
ncbi:MAG: 30S ribosomal protein S3 [Candidatus Bathyarchaeota archaeon]|nr:MAG: 30S ribosomal protein S3 [Candidatus Bathyarchaeota archaeon]